ncbi:hypothetical protein N7499_009773 [Penicillium canescens]|nr:hypothetical protein N7499_009773 [Penicillium canescens]
MKIRSAPTKGKKSEETTEQSQPKVLVSEKPSKTFILPSASGNARLLSLPQPQSGELSRYFFCPERGVYEFTVVAPPAHMARSILFTPRTHQCTSHSEEKNENDEPSVKPTITKKAELLVATPIDAMFFMVPLLAPSSKAGQSLFQPLDDIIDSNDDMPKHLRQVLYDETFRSSLLARVEAVCDTVEAGDEKMFRFNEIKLVKELITKAERMADRGLPVSLEERFIRQALATPLICRDKPRAPKDGDSASKSEERQDSPSTVATNDTPSVATPAGESTPVPQPPGTDSTALDHVTRLLRISTALSYMKESYLPDAMAARLDEILASAESPLDLKPLKDRLKEIAELRAQALASRNMSDFTRKRGLDDEEEDVRAEKKQKKAAESQAVKNLKKVNTSGMQKMSAFFAKAPPKKKT